MWLFGFGIVLQILVILELALNRVIAVVSNSRRNPVRKLADGSFCASGCATAVSVLTIPVSVVVATMQLLVNYLTFWAAALLIIGTLAVLSETSNSLIAAFVTTYNAGVGQLLYEFVTSWYQVTAPLFRVLIPIYNAVVYVLLLFWLDVILPMVYTNVNVFPELIANLTVYFGTLAFCVAEWLKHITTCTSGVALADSAASPFWINDLSCVGNANFLTLDLMSPALYAQRSATALQTIFETSCAPISNVVGFMMYPLLDINLYKAAHGLVNAVLHVAIGLPITTVCRCSYARNTRDYNYTALEKAVMCTPDVTYATTLMVGGVRAAGTTVDNWLDFLVVALEKSFFNITRSCEPTLISYVWKNASDIFGTSEMHVVGLTPSMYAITDGDSVVYHSMIGANVQTAYALHTWPFKVDMRFGISAVRHSAVSDTDDEGDERTGMLGCRCVDSEAADSGIELVCASIPFQKHLAESDEENSKYTVHRVRFSPEWASADLTCAQVVVRVVPLRFSRRRFSRPLSNGVDAGVQDAFNTQNQFGARTPVDYTSDAAIMVTPKCTLEPSARCAPAVENCFPFCMGLHAAGQRSQNITLMNAMRWNEWTSIGQTDCVVGGMEARECDAYAETTRLLHSENVGVEAIGCAATACVPDRSTVTFIKNSEQELANRSLTAWLKLEPWGFVRSERQPFASAGDIFLYQTAETDTSGQIVVTRLYDNKRGDFSLQQEKLSLVSNNQPIQYHRCGDEACYVQQLRKNTVVLPNDIFIRDSPTLAASSEWAVHWTATPSTGVCAAILDFCAETAGDSITLEMHRPRVWTLRTVRHTDGLGKAFTDETLAAYMLIPDWFSCTKADFREQSQCNRFYNMKVTGLEYINAENLLLTVLAATPSDWDWEAEHVRDNKPFEYRFYFLHPNRHDCTGDDQGVEVMYTCWRRAEEGMFIAESMITETGAICPMLQRMPKWGSMVTEVFVAQVYLAQVLLETAFVIPFFLSGDVNEIFAQHAHPTFHVLTDSSGAKILELEDSLHAMEMSAFHAANTISRVATAMKNLGSSELQSALIGTARVYQHTSAISSVEGQVFGRVLLQVSGRYKLYMNSMSEGIIEVPPALAPGVPEEIAKKANNRWIRLFQSMAGSLVSWSRTSVRLMRKIVLKITRRGGLLRTTGTRIAIRDVASTVIVSLHESENEISRGLFDNMRTVCDASGQVFGNDNAWGQSVRHSCMLAPDSMEGFIRSILIFTVDYPIMSCVCKESVGYPVEQILNDVCLPAILPMSAKAYVIKSIAAKSTSDCFDVMDATNEKLLTAFDPLFSRMVKAQAAVESALGLFVTQTVGLDVLNAKCLNFESPYTVSILPEPVDYFMGCMHTTDCRTRCLDTFKAFDDALLVYKAQSVEQPSLVVKSQIEVESRFFADSDMEHGKHLAPFAVYAVVQLPDAVCQKTCGPGHTAFSRCVAVAGLRDAVLRTAYYCTPASLITSVYEGVQPTPAQNTSTQQYSDDLLSPLVAVDVEFATVHMITYGRPEWLVVLARDSQSGDFSVWVMPSDVPDAAFRVLETKAYSSGTESRANDAQDNYWNLQTIKHVRVLPAHSTRRWATVFVVGTRRILDSIYSETICLYVYIDTNYEGSIIDLQKHYCASVVYSPAYETVCLDIDCSEVVRVPTDGTAAVSLETLVGYGHPDELGREVFNWDARPGSTRTFAMPETQRKVLDIDRAAALTITQDMSVQLTRRTLSMFGSVTRGRFADNELSVDVPLTGRATTQQTWLQNVRLKVRAGGADVQVAPSFSTKHNMEVVVHCTVTSCTGCHGSGPLEIDLQNKCFAAASCGVSQCVGTPVNMKRPLCQLASLAGIQVDLMRVLIQSFWDFFSRTIILIVELSKERRTKYEYSAPADAMMSMICNAKDGIVETNALFGSLYAQIQDGAMDGATLERTSLTSTLAYTENVMMSVAIVEFLSSIFMAALYPPIVAWRGMQCGLNDIFLVVVGISKEVTSGTGGVESFRIGNSKLDKFEDAAVTLCLTDKFKQDLADISDSNVESSMMSGMNDIFSGISDFVITYKYGVQIFALDALFAWMIGVTKSTMNLLQVADLSSCKIPETENNLVGSCVCGDKPGRIPNKQRASVGTDAMWCRGMLLMNSIDGTDILVWNPYSFEELLRRNDGEIYFQCIASYGTQCARKKPVDATFETQGVDVLQVIGRCRTNYQQKKWDEGTFLLGLLEYDEWLPVNVKQAAVRQLYTASSGAFENHRRRLAQLGSLMNGFVDLDLATWSCLRAALDTNDWLNNCADLAFARGVFEKADSPLTYFQYELLQNEDGSVQSTAETFANLDACETFSGNMKLRNAKGIAYPKMAWDGNSQNAVSVATLHNKLQYKDSIRLADAEKALDELIKTQIKPAFDRLTEQTLAKIQTEFWSFEGDFIHQLVDCVILGPYAAADMLPTVTLPSRRIAVPQYHRGRADSREIHYDLQTHGSPARVKLMQEVIALLSDTSDKRIQSKALQIIGRLRKLYTTKKNMYCTCLGHRDPSLECCLNQEIRDLSGFASSFSAGSMVKNVTKFSEEFNGELMDAAIEFEALRNVWYDQETVADWTIPETDRDAMRNLYAFDYSQPVREYSVGEVPKIMNKTLWRTCMESLDGVFFTMPLRVGSDGGVNVDADTLFDPLEVADSDAATYMHGMERAIEKILEKAKLHAPTYWSHVHRYMPSDSVWCEEHTMRAVPPKRAAAHPAQWNGLNFTLGAVAAPTADEVLYVGRLGSTCVCGWGHEDATCFVPEALCASVQDSSERWQEICTLGSYSTPSDAMLVRRVLFSGGAYPPQCDEQQASTVWGLLDTAQQKQWYDGSPASWNVSLHEIAAHGPAGVRLGMLAEASPLSSMPEAPAADPARALNAQFDHTVAQPFCRSSQERLFVEDLTRYFRDVLFPMAHAVHEAPSKLICGRWVVEYALFVALEKMSGLTAPAVVEQRAVEERWRNRCTYQLEIVGMCTLRDVYAYVPRNRQSTDHCKFSMAPGACVEFVVTDGCLVVCDGVVYDPCMCSEDQCQTVFSKHTCADGLRSVLSSSRLEMSSLHWPQTVWPANPQHQATLESTLAALKQDTHPITFEEGFFDYVRQQARRSDGEVPDAFCDDLIDYMDPDAQHPAGYHPTCACDRSETNMRGFDAWMSTMQDSEHAHSIDPVRMRNMSAYSTAFGAAHLTCDATAYMSGVARPHSMHMQSKWSPKARADASMPILPDASSEEGMTSFGAPSYDPHDTPLQTDVRANEMFRHSVGLVRDWLRDYDSVAGQSILDELWPHWMDATNDRFAAPSQDELVGSCHMPPLLQCFQDNDCILADAQLRCRKSWHGQQPDEMGICVRAETCYQHAHCPDDKLCSGTGFCEQPEIVIYNSLLEDISAQIFAKDGRKCQLSSFGVSAFQVVPTFAHDNGLCGVHELFNYRNATQNADVSQTLPHLNSVRSHMIRRIKDDTLKPMTDLTSQDAYNILKMQAHACDRDYEHSDFGICTPESFDVFIESDAVSRSKSTRTWRKKNENTYLDFCNLQVGGGSFGALTSPYILYDENGQSVDTLTHVKTTIKKCSDYPYCPSTVYTVRGEKTERYVFDVVAGTRETFRLYRTYDAEQCLSFGVWDKLTERCFVDRLIVPIFSVLFTDSEVEENAKQIQEYFNTLRAECPTAFGVDNSAALSAFEHTYALLTRAYDEWDATAKYDTSMCDNRNDASVHNSFCVLQSVNQLTLKIFNADGKNYVGEIKDMDTYKEKARCATHVYRKLQQVHDKNKAAFEQQSVVVPSDRVPGSTMYMFSGHFPVEVPLVWIWKCVLVASEVDGGAPRTWFETITDETQEYSLKCPNLDAYSKQDKDLRRHLQLQLDIYQTKTQSETNTDVYGEMLEIMQVALDYWAVASAPTVQCRMSRPDHNCNAKQYDTDDRLCWIRVIRSEVAKLTEQKKIALSCTDEESTCTIFDVILKILFGRNRKALEKMNIVSINWLVQQKLARELTLTYEFNANFNYSDTIPEFELTNLQFLNESVIYNTNAEAYSTSAQQVTCPDKTEALPLAEYEINKDIFECAKTQTTGEFCIYKKIIHTREFSLAYLGDDKYVSNEISAYYDIEGNSTVAISQKQMLLLVLYFLREVMYIGSSSKFGTMRYNTDVRRFMQGDLQIARTLASRLNDVRVYDYTLKKNNFHCPENLIIAEPKPSEVQHQLRRCLEDLKLSTGWRIPKGKTVMLQADRDMFLNSFYASFSEVDAQAPFLDELVNTDWHKLENSHPNRRLCFSTPEGAAHLFPLWSGGLDLQSCPYGESCGCQISLQEFDTFFDLTCDNSQSMESCKDNFPLFYDNVMRKMDLNCWREQGRVVSVAQYEQMKLGNLCSRTPPSGTCTVAFGSQGGVVGRAADDLHKISEITRTQTGLFDAANTLFRAERTPDRTQVTAIQLLRSDIGGHSIAFKVWEIGSGRLKNVVMDVTCVSAGLSCKAAHPTIWLRNIRNAWSMQHNVYVRSNNVNRASTSAHWHCPLQWLSAYSDRKAKYAARSPSAERNRIRFGHITGDKAYAHPTVAQTVFVTQHPARFLSDGSACVDGVVVGGSVYFDCHGKEYLHSAILMHNGKWNTVKFVNQKVASCTKLLDWPHKHYGTVDGNDTHTTETAGYCNVFWRLPSFALRYAKRLDTDVSSYSWKPTDKDGACHMGRLRKFSQQETGITQFCTAGETHTRCRMLQRDETVADASKYSWNERDFEFVAPFRPTKRPALRHRKCSRCDRHDTASFIDRRQREVPLRNGTAQLSAGQPVVVSTERVIAAALRRHACPDARNASCLKMYDAVGASNWKRGELLEALLASADEYQHNNTLNANDDALWATPWVVCARAGAGQKIACSGTITKQEWRDVSTRFGACRRESTPLVSEKKSVLDFCLLSDQTGELCQKISDWNAAITNVLCVAGKHPHCTSRAFYYNPSQYSLSNKDFVYNSISQLYTKLDSGACPKQDSKADFSGSNLLQSCQSIAVAPVLEILKVCRNVVRLISMITYYFVQAALNTFAILATWLASASGPTEQIQYYMELFKSNLTLYVGLLFNKIRDVLEIVYPLLWNIYSNGTLKFMELLLKGICEAVKLVIVPIVKNVVLPFVKFFEDAVQSINGAFCKIGICNLIQESSSLKDTIRTLEDFDMQCEFTFTNNKVDYNAPLPAATRCWAAYNTFYGDSSMLSCRNTDTCYKSITDTTLVKCSMCEEPFQDYKVFGCSDLTKTCTCNLPTFREQECISNEECFASDAVCRFIDNDLEPSIGFTRCEACQTKRVCLVTAGRSTGYCACGLLNIEFARCTHRGEAVIPGYNKLCIYTQDYNYLKTTSYIFSFYTTVTVPCATLNPASAACAAEGNDNELYVVGTESVRRRHLLAVGDAVEMTAEDTHDSLCKDALSSEHMPAHRRLCVQTFRASQETLRELGLSTLPPCSFCSKADAMEAFFMRPHNLFVVFTNVSRVLHVIMKHTVASDILGCLRRVRKDVNTAMHLVTTERVLEAEYTNGSVQVRAVIDDENVQLLAGLTNFILALVPQKNRNITQNAPSGNSSRRKLLSIDDVAQSIENKFEMSAELRSAFEAQLTSALDFSFETGQQKIEWPNAWPPKLGIVSLQGNSCPPLKNMLRNTDAAFSHIGSAYSKENQSKPVSSMQEAWVKVERRSEVNVSWADYDALLASEGVVTASVLWLIEFIMSLFQSSPNLVFDVSASGIEELVNAFKCDFEAVQTCSKWRVHVFTALIVVCVYYFIVYVLFSAVGLALPVIVAFGAVIPLVMYWSYGYSPLCFPSIPVCLYDDILWSLQQFTPKNIELPAVWYKNGTCAAYNTTISMLGPCIRKCSDRPFSYLEWYDPLSWWMVDFNSESWLVWAARESFVSALFSEDTKYDIQSSVDFRVQVLGTQNDELIYTNRICAALTTYKLLPFLMLLGILVLIGLGTLQALFVVANAVLQSTFLLLLSAFY